MTALAKVQQLYNKELWIFNTCQATHAQLYCLKKVYKKLHFKKHLFREQGIQELKATEVKENNSLEAKSLATQVAYLLPLADFFEFNSFFLMLPDIIFDNTPVPFL